MSDDAPAPGSPGWERVRSLFGEALERSPDDREVWLEDAARGDAAVLAEVRSLLARADAESLEPSAGAASDAPSGAASGAGPGQPERVGRYRILSLLGEGGMGAVYEAEQTNPNRRVALKVIRVALATRDMRRRFELEGEVLGRLRHPAIAQVYETGSAELAAGVEVPYLAMERVAGARTLTGYVAAELPELRDRLELFCDIADGVEHAHQRGIVHRDLKPANVLVDRAGHPKIIDFGLARAVGEDSDLLSMHTRTGQIMGTPLYMSPEQFTGSSDGVGTTSDVYSLGVMLFELVSGELPHDLTGLGVVEMARVVREQPARTLSGTSTGTRLRDDLDTIVGKALEKLPERRYETAAQLAADVRRYLRHEPVLARPASAFYQLRLFARRHRTLVASAVVLFVMALVAAGVSLSFAFDAEDRAREAERLAYVAALAGAADAVEDGRTEAARHLLDGTPERLRGWEFEHLRSRLETVLSSPLPEAWRVMRLETSRAGTLLAVLHGSDTERHWSVVDTVTWEERFRIPSVDIADEVRSMARFSRGGRQILFGWKGGRVHERRDATTGALLGRVERDVEEGDLPPRGSYGGGWFAGDTRYVVGHELGVAVYDAATDELVTDMAEMGWCGVSGNGRWMLVNHPEAYELIDLETLEPVPGRIPQRSLTGNGVVSLRAASRGASFAVSLHDGSVDILDVVDGRLVLRRKLEEAVGMAGELAWARDGRRLAVAGIHGFVLWDTEDGRRLVHRPAELAIHSLAFLPETGDLLSASLGGGHSVRPLDRREPGVRRHSSYVYPVRLSPDGELLVSGGWDGLTGDRRVVRLWDPLTSRLVATLGDAGQYATSVAVSPDGRTLLAGIARDNRQPVVVVDLETGAAREVELPKAWGNVEVLEFFPDGRRVLTAYQHGKVYVWDLATGEVEWVRHVLDEANGLDPHGAAALSPDGRLLAVAEDLTDVMLFETTGFEPVGRWTAHEESLWKLSFSPDGRWIVTASNDDTVGVWDVASGALVARLVGHGADVLCARVSPDGTRLASGGRDGSLRIWDTADFDPVAVLDGHDNYIYSLCWSSDSRQLFTGSGDATLRRWDTRPLDEQLARMTAEEALLPRLEREAAEALRGAEDPVAAGRALLADPARDDRERRLLRQILVADALRRGQARRRGVEAGAGVADAPGLAPAAPAWYAAPRRDGELVIDGRLDEAAWAEAPWTTAFVDIEGAARPLPEHVTRARMLWDDTHLYVAAELAEPHVWGTLTEHDSIIYRDNDFEVFLDPDGDGRWYGEFEVNALNTLFDLRLDRAYNRGGRAIIGWSPPDVHVGVDVRGTLNDPTDVDEAWTVELAIPFACLADHTSVAVPPEPGDVWRLNFSRVQWQHDVVDGAYVKREGVREDNWVWSPQFEVNMHLPRRWGFVEFLPAEG